MLTIDYELYRDEKDEEKLYRPRDEFKEITGPISCIQAPNGKGKSTTLNIISAAFFGDKDDPAAHRISPTLQNKISDLLTRKDDQKFSYKISLTSPSKDVTLVAAKDLNSDTRYITEIRDGAEYPLTFNTFKEKYFLIYEIPDNPIEKLKDMTQDVLQMQMEYEKRLYKFKEFVQRLQNEINNARDETVIEQKRQERDNANSLLQTKTEERTQIQEIKDIVKKYYAVAGCSTQFSKLSDLEIEKMKIKSSGVTATVKTTKKRLVSSTLSKEISDNVNTLRGNARKLMEELQSIDRENFSEVETTLGLIEKLNAETILASYTINDAQINSALDKVEERILVLLEDEQYKNAKTKEDFYTAIIDVLEEYETKNVSLPGTKTSLRDLIKLICADMETTQDYVKIYNRLVNSKALILSTRSILANVEKNLGKLKIRAASASDDSVEIEVETNSAEEEKKLNKEINDAQQSLNYFKKLLSDELKVPSSEYNNKKEADDTLQKMELQHPELKIHFIQTEADLLEKITEWEKQIEQLSQEIKKNEMIRDRADYRLESLEKAEPHQYKKYTKEIDNLRRLADKLSADLESFNKIVKAIHDEKTLDTEEELKYNDILSLYLAERIPEFPFDGKFYKPKRIDLSRKKIETTSGKVLSTGDISTGQGMSMYIHSLLTSDSQANKERKYIVIFDEAHTMDKTSFQPIKEELIELNNRNKLLCALFVKPKSDTFQVIDLC